MKKRKTHNKKEKHVEKKSEKNGKTCVNRLNGIGYVNSLFPSSSTHPIWFAG